MNKFAGNQSTNTKSSNKTPRIGELLVGAEIITPEILNESLQIAKTSKSMIGRTLVTLGRLDEQKLHAALEVQTLIRKGVVNTHIGIKALGMACHSRTSIEEALSQLGWQPQSKMEVRESRLTELLLATGLISKQLLEKAVLQSQENNLPLGRCLVVNRLITQSQLESVLFVQSLIKDEHITADQALTALKTSFSKRRSLEHSLIEFGMHPLSESDRRIGDILCLAGFISETGKLTALEKSLNDDIPIANVLIESETITPDLIDKTLTLQTQILTGHISLNQASNILKRSQAEGLDLQILLAEITAKGHAVNQIEQLLDLLVGTGSLTEEIIATARQNANTNGKNLGDVILSEHKISQSFLDAAWQAKRMIDDRMMSFNYACSELQKLNGNKETQQNAQDALQQSYYDDAAIESSPPKTWLTKLTDKLFNKKFR